MTESKDIFPASVMFANCNPKTLRDMIGKKISETKKLSKANFQWKQ